MALGSELLVRRHGGVFAWTSLVAGILLLGIAAFFLSPGWRAPVGAYFFGTFGAIFLLGGVALLTTVYEFYEAALVRRTLFGSSELPYRDLRDLRVAAERRYAKLFIPAGVAYEIEFVRPNGRVWRLHTTATVASDTRVDDVLSHIAQYLPETAGDQPPPN
jgi:hypothetical protein